MDGRTRHNIVRTYHSKAAQKTEAPSVYTAKKYDVKQQTVAAVLKHHND
jgi:hypothetical protein